MTKIALVTGAGRGIGLAIAKKLKDDGFHVIATARKQTDIQNLNTLGFNSYFLDVTDFSAIKDLYAELKQKELLPDILVNNAGIGSAKLLPKISLDDWMTTINTNLTSIFIMTQSFIPHMSKNKYGRIINISSVLSSFAQKGFAHYSASKAGIEGFTRTVALEYAHKGITVNAVCAGFVDTDMLSDIGEEGKNLMTKGVPMGFMAQPMDIAGLVAYLASDCARYISGESIQINGMLYTK